MHHIIITDNRSFSLNNPQDLYLWHQLPMKERDYVEKCRLLSERQRRMSVRLLLLKGLKYLLPDIQGELIKLPSGKPCFNGAEGLSISFTHSGNLSAVAITDKGEVGLDIEKVSSMNEDLLTPYMTNEELRVLSTLNTKEEKQRYLVQIWTGKEACSKWLGVGLAQPLNSMDVGVANGIVKIGFPKSQTTLTLQSFTGKNYGLSVVFPLNLGTMDFIYYAPWYDSEQCTWQPYHDPSSLLNEIL